MPNAVDNSKVPEAVEGVLSSVESAIEDFKAGKMVIIVDDEDRENEGDLVVAAEFATPDSINFMATYGRGLICLAMDENYIDKLNLPMMTARNNSPMNTAFTVSIEAKVGVTTGISAADRARTIAVAIDDASKAEDIVSPGHVFPLKAKPGGVLVRGGQTEGSVDLAKLSDLKGAAVICEIMNADGTMSRLPDLETFSKAHDVKIISIEQLIAYRLQHQSLVEMVAESRLPIDDMGEFQIKVYKETLTGVEHVVLQKGEVDETKPTLVRVHSACLTGDIFGSSRCDCGEQLDAALNMIAEEGGIMLYMHQEGRGIGLANKIKAYALQDKGCDTVEANHRLGFKADNRDYGIGSQILRDLGLGKITLMTNNPRKIHGIKGYNLEIVGRAPVEIEPSEENRAYLKTKREKLGHLLSV